MDHKQTLDVPTHADNDTSKPVSTVFSRPSFKTQIADTDASKPASKFTTPIYIEMGDEEPEFLESHIKEKVRLKS